jgi:hypothetical protein
VVEDTDGAMTEVQTLRHARERRSDAATADIVEVGLLFATVFGRSKAEVFFRCTIVEAHVYRRVLLGRTRGPRQRDDAGDDFFLD